MEHIRPADIERRSMEIITAELNARGITLPAENAPIIKRVIHTTADFDYVEHLFFTPDAVQKGIAALLRGETIVTDTNMALSGVSKPGLKKLGGQAAPPGRWFRRKQRPGPIPAASMRWAMRPRHCLRLSGEWTRGSARRW